MNKLLLILITSLSLQLSALAAITEYYVSSAGAVPGLGTTIDDPMSFAVFDDYMTAAGVFNAVAGDRFNIVATNVIARTTTASTWVNGGTATSPVIIRGYRTAITDGYLGRTVNGTGVLNTNNMAVITFTSGLLTISGNFIILESILFRSTRAGTAINVTGSDNQFARCLMDNNNTGATASAVTFAGRETAFNCDIRLLAASGGAAAIVVNGTGSRVLGCRIMGATADGITLANNAQIIGNTIHTSSNGINASATGGLVTIQNNTITGCSSNGIRVITGTTVLVPIINNMITDNAGYGVDAVSAANALFVAHNRWRDNALGNVNLATDSVAATSYSAVTTDTGGPETDYVDASAKDFRLIAASPAANTGIPAYSSIGAFQFTNSASAGGEHSYGFAQ